ncbi:unnamed protein product, partial [Mesorhabditis spiculigera]
MPDWTVPQVPLGTIHTVKLDDTDEARRRAQLQEHRAKVVRITEGRFHTEPPYAICVVPEQPDPNTFYYLPWLLAKCSIPPYAPGSEQKKANGSEKGSTSFVWNPALDAEENVEMLMIQLGLHLERQNGGVWKAGLKTLQDGLNRVGALTESQVEAYRRAFRHVDSGTGLAGKLVAPPKGLPEGKVVVKATVPSDGSVVLGGGDEGSRGEDPHGLDLSLSSDDVMVGKDGVEIEDDAADPEKALEEDDGKGDQRLDEMAKVIDPDDAERIVDNREPIVIKFPAHIWNATSSEMPPPALPVKKTQVFFRSTDSTYTAGGSKKPCSCKQKKAEVANMPPMSEEMKKLFPAGTTMKTIEPDEIIGAGQPLLGRVLTLIEGVMTAVLCMIISHHEGQSFECRTLPSANLKHSSVPKARKNQNFGCRFAAHDVLQMLVGENGEPLLAKDHFYNLRPEHYCHQEVAPRKVAKRLAVDEDKDSAEPITKHPRVEPVSPIPATDAKSTTDEWVAATSSAQESQDVDFVAAYEEVSASLPVIPPQGEFVFDPTAQRAQGQRQAKLIPPRPLPAKKMKGPAARRQLEP